MKEKTLFKIALVCSLVGLVALFFVSDRIEVREIDVGKITATDIGKEIKVLGRIERISDTDKVMFLEVGQEKVETVSVVLFKEEEIKLEQGDYIELLGELDDYKGEVSIVANAVKVR